MIKLLLLQRCLLCILLISIIASCAPTTILLPSITPVQEPVLDHQNKHIALLVCSDGRTLKAVGYQESGAEVHIEGDLSHWITTIFANALRKKGYVVTVLSKESLLANATSYIIAPELKSLHVTQAATQTTVNLLLQIRTKTNTGGESSAPYSGSSALINNPFGNTEGQAILNAVQQAVHAYITEKNL